MPQIDASSDNLSRRVGVYGAFGFPPASNNIHKVVKMRFCVGKTDEVDESMLSWVFACSWVPATKF